MTAVTASTTTHNRLILLLIVAVFVVPIATATGIFYFAPPTPSAQHGELLSPPLDLRALALTDAQGQSTTFSAFSTNWRLVYALAACAGDDCAATADLLRRMHAALGKDAHRVTPLLLAPTLPPTAPALAAQIRGVLAPGVYLVDPQGFAALRYPADTDPQGVLKDLRRLLKYAKG